MPPSSLHTMAGAASSGMRCRIEGGPYSSFSRILGSKGVFAGTASGFLLQGERQRQADMDMCCSVVLGSG